MIYQVLIVDDEEIVCRGLKEFVKWETHGFEVSGIAYSVDEALSILGKNYIDVIFTDITMPVKSGLDLLRAISERDSDIKTVILSGYSEFKFAKEALRYGAVDYLTKPVDLKEVETLLDRLHQALDHENQSAKLQRKRVEGLLLSLARGYTPYREEQYEIPEIGRWYGLSIGLKNRDTESCLLESRLDWLQQKLATVFSEVILLPYEATKLFMILPCDSKQKLDETLALLESLFGKEGLWACGISNLKCGMSKIAEAFYEAGQALQYLVVRQKGDFLTYKNIESIYETNAPDIMEFLQNIFCMLTDSSTRENVKKATADYLFRKYRENENFMEQQLLCIRGLIEMKGYLHNMQVEQDIDTLNKSLFEIMRSNCYEELERAVITYIESLIDAINKKSENQLGNGVIREIQIYIQQHFGEDISLQMLAEQFYLHPNYLSRLFKEKTGENFTEYLTRIRMNKAMELLDCSDYKIVEICEIVGYDNPRYLSKIFKQYTGKTPREYRERADKL